MNWCIVTDSSCDYNFDKKLSENIYFSKIPFTISIGDKEYIDDSTLDVSSMIDNMDECKDVGRTACPAPGAWYEAFKQADQIIAITISSNLSGSYNSALAAKELLLEEHPGKKIFILDSRSTGPAMALYVKRAAELIEGGMEFDAVSRELKAFVEKRHTVFALSSFGNLVKNGRMSKLAGFVAGKLNLWGIGIGSNEGRIVIKGKTRGTKGIISQFINEMKENKFESGHVVISHCLNPVLAEKLKVSILDVWKDAEVEILRVSGLCGYYAERNGLIVAY